MNERYSHLKAYSFIKSNRLKKKIKLYRLALSVIIDKTTAIYLSIIILYVVSSFFILNDFTKDYYDVFLFVESLAEERFWIIVTILPIIYILSSFKNPGVIFSSSEYQLTLLPYSREKIWFLTMLEKCLKHLINLFIISLFIIFLTPISPKIIMVYAVLLILFNIIMTVPQWKLFQVKTSMKIFILSIAIIVHLLNLISDSSMIIGITVISVLVFLNIFLLKKGLFHQVKWEKVTEISDFHIWTMFLISKVSEVKMKRQRKYSIFQNLAWRKSPFKYDVKPIHHRLWQIYLTKNIQLVFNIIGALFALLFVFSFQDGQIFHIVLPITIHIYSVVLRTFFIGRFDADIVQVLPWDLKSYKRSYVKWVLIGGIILLIPICLFLAMNISIWLPLQLFSYISIFIYLYHLRIDQAMMTLSKKYSNLDFTIGYLLLIGLGFSWKFPYILFVSLSIPFLIKYKRKDF